MIRLVGLLLASVLLFSPASYANADTEIVCKRNALGGSTSEINPKKFPRTIAGLSSNQPLTWSSIDRELQYLWVDSEHEVSRIWSAEGNYLQHKKHPRIRYKCNVAAWVVLQDYYSQELASQTDGYICVRADKIVAFGKEIRRPYAEEAKRRGLTCGTDETALSVSSSPQDKPKRGWLGVFIQEVTPQIAESLGLEEAGGALVSSVNDNSPAKVAGLEPGDVINSFDGKKIDKLSDLPRIVAETDIGATVDVELVRNGSEMTVQVTLGELENAELVGLIDEGEQETGSAKSFGKLGFTVEGMTTALAEEYGLDPETRGVIVTEVVEGGPAFAKGLEVGHIIKRFGQKRIEYAADLSKFLAETQEAGRAGVLLLVESDGRQRFIQIGDVSKTSSSKTAREATTSTTNAPNATVAGRQTPKLPSDDDVCDRATTTTALGKRWSIFDDAVDVAKSRGLTCGVGETVTRETANAPNATAATRQTPKLPSDDDVCDRATTTTALGKRWSIFDDAVDVAKSRGLTCGVGEAVTGEVASTTSTVTSSAPTTPSVSLIGPQTPSSSISTPSSVEEVSSPTISIVSKTLKGAQATIQGRVINEAGLAEVIIDGEAVDLGSDGSFTASFYVPRSGKTVEIAAFDNKGNKATKSLVLERGQVQQSTGPTFASLNPSGKRVRSNQDALALIIGVADYERTPARAAYADKDAQTFYDYAMLKLGIPATNIKELINTDANEAEVRLAVKDWIARSTRQGQSDVYVFFAGHGLANQSGDDMYLLPVDGEPRLLSDTAIERERLFADIAAANPRSVTVFLDTCYSGTTRGTDMLIASRPIAIRAKEQAVPEGFTVMTAAAGDQTAKPLEEAKHGMFSYFLMKGMEGDADANSDNQITAGELHAYVQQNVIQQSSGSQTPELQGDADRVLVRFQ